MEQVKPKFGEGFYTATDAANILNLPYSKISYWFRAMVRGRFEAHTDFRYYFRFEDVTAVNFYTLIELYVFNFFRQNKVSVNKILTAHFTLSEFLETPYPFSHYDILLSSGGNILFDHSGGLFEATPGFQQAIKEYVLPYGKKIHFENKMARKYYPFGKDHSVVIDPRHQFGSPFLEGTNIKVSTIASLKRGGESIELLAEIFKITTDQVIDALTFAKAA